MKVFPIKVEPVETRHTNIVEWMISDVCNYDCSFCPSNYKSRAKRFLDLDTYKKTIDKLTKESNGKKIWFKITGGEPTLYSNFIELMSYIKETGNYTYVITNGSRTVRYWEDLRDSGVMDTIAFTYHPEQTSDLKHMIDVVNLFSEAKTLTLVNITCAPKYFTDAIFAYQSFMRKCLTMVNLLNINDEHGMEKYTIEQQEMFKKYVFAKSFNFGKKVLPDIPENDRYHNGLVKYTYNDNTEKIDHASNFIKRCEDNFLGYDCHSGINALRIEHETVQRAVCGVGERWSIYDESLFVKNSVTCTQSTCHCIMDMMQPKYATIDKV